MDMRRVLLSWVPSLVSVLLANHIRVILLYVVTAVMAIIRCSSFSWNLVSPEMTKPFRNVDIKLVGLSTYSSEAQRD